MGAQRLAPRTVRRVARATGLPLVRGWSHGGYVYGFVTADHLHGWYDKKTGEWGFDAAEADRGGDGFLHYTSCAQLFHHPIPRGAERIKMVVEPGLVTLASLRHYRELLAAQAPKHGYVVAEPYIHARYVAVGHQVAVVLERAVTRRKGRR